MTAAQKLEIAAQAAYIADPANAGAPWDDALAEGVKETYRTIAAVTLGAVGVQLIDDPDEGGQNQ